MGHYDTTHTCGEDDHDYSDENVVNQEVEVVIHDGEPCLKVHYRTEFRCSQEGTRYNSNGNNYMTQCQRSKPGRGATRYIPLSELGDIDA